MRLILSFFMICLLAGCASSNVGGKGKLAGRFGAYSSGVGEATSFEGDDLAENSKLQAPHDQTYYFSFDSSDVDYDDVASIDAQASYLNANNSAKLVLKGYTDERGSREYNIALAERRAKRVADILKIDGVRRDQIAIVSYGEEKPIKLGHNETAWKFNRRVRLQYEAK